MIEHRFEDGAGVVERQADTQREQAGQKHDFLHPGARMQFALRANIEDCDRDGSGQKNRHINQQRADPAGLRAAGRGMEQDDKTSEQADRRNWNQDGRSPRA